MAVNMLSLMLVLAIVAVTSINGQRNIALTGARFREIQLGQNAELLQFAALSRETVIIVIDAAETLAVVQESVNANFWCLPWLERFPGGTIQWLFQNLGENFDTPQMEVVLETAGRRRIGGQFNEWLNITGTIVSAGAEAADTGRYACEVCFMRGTVFEECHRANISLQGIGAPPDIIEVPDNTGPEGGEGFEGTTVTYRIGADFCVPIGYRGQLTIPCDIADGPPAAFPTPDRGFSLDGVNIYSSLISLPDPNLRDSLDFFAANPDSAVIFPDFFSPNVWSITGGSINFNFNLGNVSATPDLFPDGVVTNDDARALVYQVIQGDWTCFANNTFGGDEATTTIRGCVPAPSLPGCPGGSNVTLFRNTGGMAPAGCTVCIPEGGVITLDCSGDSDAMVEYVWRDSNGKLISNSPLLPIDVPGEYNCSASNVDNPTEISVSVLAFGDDVNFRATTTEVGVMSPRSDNGCTRVNRADLANADICVFVGETLDLSCVTANRAMLPLEITPLNGSVINGSLSILVDSNSEGNYSCRLSNTDGPCGQAAVTLDVRVFDPARIDRLSALPDTCIGAGRPTGTLVRSAVTLCCPALGIEDPTVAWYRIATDALGCASEVLVQESDGVTIDDSIPNRVDLTVDVTDPVTYVCRARNSAGSDAGIVSLRSVSEMGVWRTGVFSSCSFPCAEGVRTRSISCRSDIDGTILPDDRCTDPLPASENTCQDDFPNVCLLDPVWISSPWGKCTRDCNGGFRWRNVICQIPTTSAVVRNTRCRLQARPATFDVAGCDKACCLRDTSSSCRIAGSDRCGEAAYRKSCCWTCGLKVID